MENVLWEECCGKTTTSGLSQRKQFVLLYNALETILFIVPKIFQSGKTLTSQKVEKLEQKTYNPLFIIHRISITGRSLHAVVSDISVWRDGV